MSNYADEHAKYWPIPSELMARYRDGSHTKDYEGNLYWLKDDQLHRDGDLPTVIWANGCLEWSQNGLRHRNGDRPAYIGVDGSVAWFQNNLRHRRLGPARIYRDGTPEWWWRGKHIPVTSQYEFVQYLTSHKLIEDKPKMITASEARAIYEEAIEKKNLLLRSQWEEIYVPKLDKLIRARAELGCNFVELECATWKPMKNFIRELAGYEVREYPVALVVSWSKG